MVELNTDLVINTEFWPCKDFWNI